MKGKRWTVEEDSSLGALLSSPACTSRNVIKWAHDHGRTVNSCVTRASKFTDVIFSPELRYQLSFFRWIRQVCSRNEFPKDDQFTLQAMDKLELTQRYRCALTDDLLVPRENISPDHIIPKGKNRNIVHNDKLNSIDNLQWVTIEANLAKHSLSQFELYTLCKKVVEKMRRKEAIAAYVNNY